MMNLRNMVDTLPVSEASVRVYRSTLIFNASAVSLLRLDDDSFVSFKVDADALALGRFRCYVSKTSKGVDAFPLHRKASQMVVNSSCLARKLADGLNGDGIYRICPEDSYIINGIEWFNIYHKNYK